MLLVLMIVAIHWNACFYLALSNYIGPAADAWVYSQYSFTVGADFHGAMVATKKDSPYSITERRVPELIPVLAVSLQVT